VLRPTILYLNIPTNTLVVHSMELKKPPKKRNQKDIIDDMSKLEPEALEDLLTQIDTSIRTKIKNIPEMVKYVIQKNNRQRNQIRRDLKKGK
jgi:hypothetical protein